MATAFATSVKQHHAAQLRVAGVDAIYMRDGESLALRMVPGRHRPEQYGTESEEVVSDASDWIVRADELVFGGEVITPGRGDRIVASGVTFEVVHQGEVAPWRYADQSRELIRIYTQEVIAGDE